MSAGKNRHRLRWLIGLLVLVAVAGGAVAVADPDGSGSSARRPSALGGAAAVATGAGGASSAVPVANTGPCGAATAQTIAAVEVHVAKRIYAGEAGGSAVAEDAAHITGSQELTEAVAAGNQPAVFTAVHAIVYTPHWHIVRLRVVRNGRILADVGGPYIIAPVSGALRQGGRKVGSYVMSVQDDVGYVKLVTRFTGVPIDLYGTPRPANGFVLGTLQPAPPLPVDGASVRVHGIDYLARMIDGRAFPDGPLKAVLLFAPPSRALAAQTCEAVRHATWGDVLKHVAARFSPLAPHYQDLAGTLQGATGGLTFVRAGSTHVAGLTAGPRRLPKSGPVRYRGRVWQVYSWEPYPPARIYFLAPS
jgi:hypothetical protein